MPTSAKDMSGRFIPRNVLPVYATMTPIYAPTNSDGANVPPTPPAALVAAMATTFKNGVASRYRITTHVILR